MSIEQNLPVLSMAPAELAVRRIKFLNIGDLDLPTGRIVGTDPYTLGTLHPFDCAVVPGRYPAEAWAERVGRGTGRVGLLAVRFSGERISSWRPAARVVGRERTGFWRTLLKGKARQSVREERGSTAGIPVDTGLVSLMDASTANEIASWCQKWEGEFEESSYFEAVDDLVVKKNTAVVVPRPASSCTMVVSKALGDGVFPTFYGFDAQNRPAVLAIDLRLFRNADAREDDELQFAELEAALTAQQRIEVGKAYEALQGESPEGLAELLRRGVVSPETYVPDAGATLTFEAIRLNKPAMLKVLLQHGAKCNLPDWLVLRAQRTYLDYAKSLKRKRSQEIIDVLEKAWDL